MTDSDPLSIRARAVRGVVFDVDGVLTDGRIIYDSNGAEQKHFHVQDGASIKHLMRHNIEVAIITGRSSIMVERRASELGIRFLEQGNDNKSAALDKLVGNGFPDGQLAAIGDDLADLSLFEDPRVLLKLTVPNAHPAVLQRADFVTQRRGGEGVAVEISQLILTAQDNWTF